MPLAIVIMILGAAGCGWLFLRARRYEAADIRKETNRGSKNVKEAAKHLAKQPSGIEPYEVPTGKEKVQMSRDLLGQVARDLAEILEKEEK